MKYKMEIEFDVKVSEESEGRYSCYIPSFDCFFSAKNKEQIEKKAKAMVKAYIEFHNDYNLNNKELWK